MQGKSGNSFYSYFSSKKKGETTMAIKNLDYITNEEATLIRSVKAKERITFSEMAEKLGTTNYFFSRVLNGKRPFPPALRENFDKWAAQYQDVERIAEEVHRDSEITSKLSIVNADGEQKIVDVPQFLLDDSKYRRASEMDREKMLRDWGVIPDNWQLEGSAYEDTLMLSAEDWSKVQTLMAQERMLGKDIAQYLGMYPTYWSRIISHKRPIPHDYLQKLHKLFETYGVN